MSTPGKPSRRSTVPASSVWFTSTTARSVSAPAASSPSITRGTFGLHPQIRTWSFRSLSSLTSSAGASAIRRRLWYGLPDTLWALSLLQYYDETNLATQGAAPQARARILLPDEHQERPPRPQGAPSPGPQAAPRLAGRFGPDGQFLPFCFRRTVSVPRETSSVCARKDVAGATAYSRSRRSTVATVSRAVASSSRGGLGLR